MPPPPEGRGQPVLWAHGRGKLKPVTERGAMAPRLATPSGLSCGRSILYPLSRQFLG